MPQIPVTPVPVHYADFLRGDAVDREMDRQDRALDLEKEERAKNPPQPRDTHSIPVP